MFNLKVSEKVTQRAHQGSRNFRALGRPLPGNLGQNIVQQEIWSLQTAGSDMRKACQDIKTNK